METAEREKACEEEEEEEVGNGKRGREAAKNAGAVRSDGQAGFSLWLAHARLSVSPVERVLPATIPLACLLGSRSGGVPEALFQISV